MYILKDVIPWFIISPISREMPSFQSSIVM